MIYGMFDNYFFKTFFILQKKKGNMFDNLKIENSFIILKTKNSLFSENIFLVIFTFFLFFLKNNYINIE